MIRWLIALDLLDDAELVREYVTGDEDDRAVMLAAEIERRGLDL